MADTQAGVGAQGLKQGGQMQADIAAMSNQAKRIAETRQAAVDANSARNLEAFRKGEELQAKSLNAQAADYVVKSMQPDATKDPKGYMDALGVRIADMTTRMKEAKKTKNVTAENTYMAVIGLLTQRLHGMQNEQMQPASQPAEEQAVAPAKETYNLRPGRTESVPGER